MKKTTKTTSPAPAKNSATAAKTPVAAPARAKAAAKPATLISAKVDVGFGNTLYVRGSSGGLSWDKGQPMKCVADDLWTLEVAANEAPFAFKLLLNDETWSTGADYTATPGAKLEVQPAF